MGNKANAVAVEDLQDVFVVPTVVAELDDLLDVLGHACEEGIQPLDVLMEARRQLIEEWA